MTLRTILCHLLALALLPNVAPFCLQKPDFLNSPSPRSLESKCLSESKRTFTTFVMAAKHETTSTRRFLIAAGMLIGASTLKIGESSAQDLSGLRKLITGGGEAKAPGSTGSLCEIYQCADASTETLGGLLKPFQTGPLSMLAPEKGWTSDAVAAGSDERFAWTDGKGGRVAVSAAPAGALAFRVPSPTAGGVFGKAVVSNDLVRVGSALARARGVHEFP